jgi:hypothetical protein
VFTYLADGPNEWTKRYGLMDTLMKVIGKRTRGYEGALKAFILTLYLERYSGDSKVFDRPLVILAGFQGIKYF